MGLGFKGIVGIIIDDLDMRSKTNDLPPDFIFKAGYSGYGNNHYRQAQRNASYRYADNRSGKGGPLSIIESQSGGYE